MIRDSNIVVVALDDNSILTIDGDFIAHYDANLEKQRLRGFTVDTIPISVGSAAGGKIPLQLVLAKTFQMIEHISLV